MRGPAERAAASEGANVTSVIAAAAKLDEIELARTGIAPDTGDGEPVETTKAPGAPANIATAPVAPAETPAKRVTAAPPRAIANVTTTKPKATAKASKLKAKQAVKKHAVKKRAAKKSGTAPCSGLDCL